MVSIQQIQADADAANSPAERLKVLLKGYPKLLRFGAGNLGDANAILSQINELLPAHGQKDDWGEYYKQRAITAFYEVQYDEAFEWSTRSIKIFEETGNKIQLAEITSGLAMAFWDLGNYGEALDHAFNVMRLYQEVGNTAMSGITSYQIGSFYYDLKDYANAEYYFSRGYELAQITNSTPTSLARCMVGLGDIAVTKGQYQEAFNFFERALAIQEAEHDTAGVARTLNDIGTTHRAMRNWEQAEYYLRKSEAIRRSLPNKTALITTLIELGELFLLKKDFEPSLQILNEAVELTKGQQTKAKRFRAFRLLSDIYKGLGNFELALEYYHRFDKLKEEVVGDEFGIKMKNLEKKAELEKTEREAEIYRLRNVELKSAYDEVDKKNRDITSSINYAKRIQDAMLPNWRHLQQYVSDAFIYFVPRDIVSGDFYWFVEKDGKAIIAAVDCTGHGVPGAFMSMIGMNLLAQIVQLKGITQPAAILEQMHIGIQEALNQSNGENRDGMDMSVCSIDKKMQTITFAGAKNPLVFIQQGELYLLKGDRMPIGGREGKEGQNFTQHSLPIIKGNTYYLFSDGFEDQFGGEECKKFKQQQLRELIASIHHLPMSEQQATLKNTFERWKGNERQIDDVLVIGFRV